MMVNSIICLKCYNTKQKTDSCLKKTFVTLVICKYKGTFLLNSF